MNIEIDAVTELALKSSKALRFNVMFNIDDSYAAIVGFRLMDGCIHPPSVRNKNNYYPVCFLGTTTAQKLYEKLKEKLEEKQLTKDHKLIRMDIAIDALTSKAKLCRYFPTILEAELNSVTTD